MFTKLYSSSFKAFNRHDVPVMDTEVSPMFPFIAMVFLFAVIYCAYVLVTNSHVYYIDLCYATFSHAFAVLFVQDTP